MDALISYFSDLEKRPIERAGFFVAGGIVFISGWTKENNFGLVHWFGLSVLLYQTALVFITGFTHANISLPKWLDKSLSWILVSPNMHKVHHHWKQPYTDSNYGAVFSIWDRLLGTFMKLDPSKIRYGLDQYYPNEKDEDFTALMKRPFQKLK